MVFSFSLSAFLLTVIWKFSHSHMHYMNWNWSKQTPTSYMNSHTICYPKHSERHIISFHSRCYLHIISINQVKYVAWHLLLLIILLFLFYSLPAQESTRIVLLWHFYKTYFYLVDSAFICSSSQSPFYLFLLLPSTLHPQYSLFSFYVMCSITLPILLH